LTDHITENHPLVLLAEMLPWQLLGEMVIADLKATTSKGCWWMGRAILVRVYLAAYLLQKFYNLTDRKVEYGLRDNAAYRLFSGITIVEGWHPPDHTKIEEFRNRLSAETQRALANELAKTAVTLGFADPSQTDFDSTVQEANIAYPSDASLITKFSGLGKKVVDYLKGKAQQYSDKIPTIDIAQIKKKALKYFFAAKNIAIEKKREIFAELHRFVKTQMKPIVTLCSQIGAKRLKRMPWNIRRAVIQIKNHAWRHFLDVAHFVRNHTIKAGKILSIHSQAVTCVAKGKAGKSCEFGRVFQLGRIFGNFMIVAQSINLKMNDKLTFPMLLATHAQIFGKDALQSVATDKGYWSKKNSNKALENKVNSVGMQRPINRGKESLKLDHEVLRLRDRRAGIEPLIGHVKHGGMLGRSRMKTDSGTLAAGYASVCGFNMRQLINHRMGKIKKVA
jgi:IS5 family transposase